MKPHGPLEGTATDGHHHSAAVPRAYKIKCGGKPANESHHSMTPSPTTTSTKRAVRPDDWWRNSQVAYATNLGDLTGLPAGNSDSNGTQRRQESKIRFCILAARERVRAPRFSPRRVRINQHPTLLVVVAKQDI